MVAITASDNRFYNDIDLYKTNEEYESKHLTCGNDNIFYTGYKYHCLRAVELVNP